jgi:tripartite-type tricarboxylate transporter receptor subunit TctC
MEDSMNRQINRRSFINCLSIAIGMNAIQIGPTYALDFPTKPLRIMVPFPPGGATDVIARVIGKRLSELLNQPVIIENKPGAGGTIGIANVASAAPDGYSLVLVNAMQHTSSSFMYPGLKYDSLRSFQTLAEIGTLRYWLVAPANSDIKDYASLIKQAKNNPGKLSYASSGVGSAPHLAMELFMRQAGIQMTHVPFTGSSPGMTALVGGHVQVAIDNVAAIPLIKSGRLRALAITGDKRLEEFPDVPTFAQSGLPEFDVVGHFGFLTTAKPPPATIEILQKAIQQAMLTPEVISTLISQGIQPEFASSQQFEQVISREYDKWAKLIPEAQIKAQ